MPRRLLSISDRVEISTERKAGWSVRTIAAAIDRAPSVVSREIRRNAGTTSGYRAATADVRAQRLRLRRPVSSAHIQELLGWSPTHPTLLDDLEHGDYLTTPDS